MTSYVYRYGKVVDKSTAGSLAGRVGGVISDTMPGMRHPITQKMMDSKSAFRAVTRAHNCVEVGNEAQRDRRSVDMPPLKGDIAHAIRELGG